MKREGKKRLWDIISNTHLSYDLRVFMLRFGCGDVIEDKVGTNGDANEWTKRQIDPEVT